MKKTLQNLKIMAIALGLTAVTGCASLTAVDPMTHKELNTLVRDNVIKMVQQPRASKVLGNGKTIKIELLDMKNNTRTYMNREWDILKNNLEEVFMNYETVEFYNWDDRSRGQDSIHKIDQGGFVKADQQKQSGEQYGADYNIQVTINEIQVNKRDKEYSMLIKWYERETQRAIAATSVYFEK